MGSPTTSGTSASCATPDLPPKKVKKQEPQKTVDQLWDAYTTKYPGKVHSILPQNVYAETKAAKSPKGIVRGKRAWSSYYEAAKECRYAVEKISKECRKVNMKYRDPHFDIEFDLKEESETAGWLSPRREYLQFVPKILQESDSMSLFDHQPRQWRFIDKVSKSLTSLFFLRGCNGQRCPSRC